MSDAGLPSGPGRGAELAARLATVRRRVERAADAAGRDPGEVTLVVVTKKFPASDVLLLTQLGVTDIGENRDQEARAKVERIRHSRRPPTVHFIGQLQTNKAASVTRYADVVHVVDRGRLVTALDRGAASAGRRLLALVQVRLDEEAGRGGVPPEEALALAAEVAAAEHLELAGVMAMAPLAGDPDAAFARLRAVAHGIRERHEQARWISAGMSGDLEAAVRNGATHLRVGTAILGSRTRLR